MNRWFSLVMFALIPALSACGPADDEEEVYDVSTSPLSGTVAGESFSVASGFARPGFEEGELSIELHPVEVEDPCALSAFTDSRRMILFSIVSEPQDVELGFGTGQTVTFAYEDADGGFQNDVATTGRLMIDEVSESTLIGGLYAEMDDHVVDGQFEVPVCEGI